MCLHSWKTEGWSDLTECKCITTQVHHLPLHLSKRSSTPAVLFTFVFISALEWKTLPASFRVVAFFVSFFLWCVFLLLLFSLSHLSTSPQPQSFSPTRRLLLVSQPMSLIWGLFSSLSLHIQSHIPCGLRAEFGQRWKARAMGNWRSL